MNPIDYKSRRKSSEYQDLLHVVSTPEPSGALVLGGVGMGKTSLVDAVMTSTGLSEPAMTLYCSPTLAAVPYGVLSPYLDALASVDEPVQVLREINHVLASVPDSDQPRIVVVEDAQYLDAQSCFVLSTLMENAAIKLIALGAGVLESESIVGQLAQSPLMSTIVVQPLDVSGIRTVAESMLGGTLSESSVGTIHRLSGGNPSFVEALIASSLEQGLLIQDKEMDYGPSAPQGIWLLSQDTIGVDSRLTNLVSEIQRLSTEDERRTLELLALGGPAPKLVLDGGRLEYRRMIDAGQLHELPDDTVALASELHRRVLRLMVPAQRSAELYDSWQQCTSELGMEQSASHVLWGLEVGQSFPTERILDAASSALDEGNYPLAWELCRAGNVAHSSGHGALFEADVLLGLGRFESARNILLRFVGTAKAPHLLTSAFSQLLVVVTNLGNNLPLMRDYIQQWKEWVSSLPSDAESAKAVMDQQFAQQLLDLWVRVNSIDGQFPEAKEFERIINDPNFPDEGQIIARLMYCDAESVVGHSERALSIAREAIELISDDPKIRALYETRLMFLQCWNLLQLGENQKAQQLLDTYRYGGERFGVQHQGAVVLMLGLSDLLQGRNQSALRRFAEAVTELRFGDPAQVLTFARNLHAMAHEFGGSLGTGTASGALESKPEPPELMGETPSRQRVFARASAATIGRPQGSEKLKDFPVFERMALAHKISHLPDEELAGSKDLKRLIELCDEHEGTKSQLLLQLSKYRAQSEPQPLEELAQKAFRSQEVLIGVEALARAAVRYSEAGESRTCGTLLRQASRVVNEQRINPNKYVARALALTELTAREAEIVQLALSGKNNAQIARVLTVSQRTVEGHLYRVFSKLGISERSELVVAELDFGTAQ